MTPDTLLRRREAAEALTAAGYKTAPATLATMASRGGGPPHRLFGRVPLYRLADLMAWAESRCTPARISTSETRDIESSGRGEAIPTRGALR